MAGDGGWGGGLCGEGAGPWVVEGVIDKGYVRGAGQGGQPGRGLVPDEVILRGWRWKMRGIDGIH
ncbi:hypothetical protein K190097F3_50310 [Enterocloster clostridioformis]